MSTLLMRANLLPGSNAIARPAAVILYVGVICALIAFTVAELSGIGERRASLAAASNMLAQLEGRSPAGRAAESAALATAPPGSPFLEGQSANIAGAALLQSIAETISRSGGSVLSSQVDLQKTDAKDGWVGLVVSCEIDQASLQKLLYEVESGMPFLFIDQLVADAPTTQGGRMRVLLGVSGQWRGTK